VDKCLKRDRDDRSSTSCPGKLHQETGPLASSTINYAYDALGRLASRAVAGEGAETFVYDAIGRLVTHASDLGSFAFSYLGQTGQITSRQLAGSTLATSWSYLTAYGDRRLAGINNVGLSTSQYSTYSYTTTPENLIAAIAETSDTATVYPTTGMQTASYNNVNALTNLSGQPFTYDANGNLLSDGTRNYSWDAESRLVGITYPGQTGKATAFAYDGLGRRSAITSTPAGGIAVATSYIWCGVRLCQARNANNAVTREHYAEGELVPGSSAQPYYYGPDQLGTVRRAFESTSSAPAYAYDPYGNPLQTTAPVTDFNYAGTFYNADSGLYLTMYRVYNPATGRWLSRDPFGEGSDPARNLYRYVDGNPVNLRDPSGEFVPLIVLLPAIGGVLGGLADVATAGPCDSLLAAFGRGFVAGASGTLTGIGTLALTGNPWVAGAAAGTASQAVDQAISGDWNIKNAVVGAFGGGLAGGVLAKLLPTVGRLPSLVIPRNMQNFGPNSLRMLGQEAGGDIATGSVEGLASSSGNLACTCRQR